MRNLKLSLALLSFAIIMLPNFVMQGYQPNLLFIMLLFSDSLLIQTDLTFQSAMLCIIDYFQAKQGLYYFNFWGLIAPQFCKLTNVYKNSFPLIFTNQQFQQPLSHNYYQIFSNKLNHKNFSFQNSYFYYYELNYRLLFSFFHQVYPH